MTLRDRAIEISKEYWECRETDSERVAVAQLVLALARAEQLASSLVGVRGEEKGLEAGDGSVVVAQEDQP